MSEIFNKITSYNLFNYLFPGILFIGEIELFTNISLKQEDIIINIALCYFIGLIISRLGSFTIEKVARKIKLVKFADYTDYIEASKTDKKIEELSESNNMYRTLISLHICVLLVCMVDFLEISSQTYFKWIVIVLFLIIFIISYKKQTGYIYKRVLKAIENRENG